MSTTRALPHISFAKFSLQLVVAKPWRPVQPTWRMTKPCCVVPACDVCSPPITGQETVLHRSRSIVIKTTASAARAVGSVSTSQNKSLAWDGSGTSCASIVVGHCRNI